MSNKRFKQIMDAREEEKCCTEFKPPIEICAIVMIAMSAIFWVGSIGVKKAGGSLPWE